MENVKIDGEPVEDFNIVNLEKNEQKKQEEKKMRQIVIETDGNGIQLKVSEVAGKIELIAILDNLSNYLKRENNI